MICHYTNKAVAAVIDDDDNDDDECFTEYPHYVLCVKTPS